jgi:hypothetical protein
MSRHDVPNVTLKRAPEKLNARLRRPPVVLESMHLVYECELTTVSGEWIQSV